MRRKFRFPKGPRNFHTTKTLRADISSGLVSLCSQDFTTHTKNREDCESLSVTRLAITSQGLEFLLESSIRNVYMRDFVPRNVDVTHDVQFISIQRDAGFEVFPFVSRKVSTDIVSYKCFRAFVD